MICCVLWWTLYSSKNTEKMKRLFHIYYYIFNYIKIENSNSSILWDLVCDTFFLLPLFGNINFRYINLTFQSAYHCIFLPLMNWMYLSLPYWWCADALLVERLFLTVRVVSFPMQKELILMLFLQLAIALKQLFSPSVNLSNYASLVPLKLFHFIYSWPPRPDLQESFSVS